MDLTGPEDETRIAPPRAFRLRIVTGESSSQSADVKAFDADVVLIGRIPECDVVIRDGMVSRRHAELRRQPEGVRLVDLSTPNGTWVDGERVRERLLGDSGRFRIGNTWFTLLLRDADGGPATTEPDLTIVAPAPASESGAREPAGAGPREAIETPSQLLDRFSREGEEVSAGGNRPILLDGGTNVWMVARGRVEIRGVATVEGKPTGALMPIMTLRQGQLMFGLDAERADKGFALIAVGAEGTLLRRLPLERLREFSADPECREEVSLRLEEWIGGHYRNLATEMGPSLVEEILLEPGSEIRIGNEQGGRAEKGAVWLEVMEGNLLFMGIELLIFGADLAPPQPADRSVVIRRNELGRLTSLSFPVFPVCSAGWIEGATIGTSGTAVRVHPTSAVITEDGLWAGLAIFHMLVSRCGLMNFHLRVVDEQERLDRREIRKDQALADARHEIEHAMDRTGVIGLRGPAADPVLAACALVGRACGIDVQEPLGAGADLSFDDRVAAIARASRFRIRGIALRGTWWKKDQGPLLARLDGSDEPVALIPAGLSGYRFAGAGPGGASGTVDTEIAEALAPFGYAFYASFPEGPVSTRTLVKEGARGLRSDIAIVAAMGVLLGLLGTLIPLFTGVLFDSAIPEAERPLVVQFAVALLVATGASTVFKITQSISVLRVQGKIDYKLQAAVWDRLLNLPSAFFREYTAGDLADRAGGIEAIRAVAAGSGVSALLGAVSGLFYVALMFRYDPRLGALALGLTAVLIGATTAVNLLQLRHQRRQVAQKGIIAGLVLQLVSGVARLRLSGAENDALRVWAREFARQRRLEFRVGRIQTVMEVFGAGFPILASMSIFYLVSSLLGMDGVGTQGARLTTGEFIGFIAAYGAFQAAMQSLSQASLDMLRIVPIYERLRPILQTTPETDRSKQFPGILRGGVELSHVSFRYAEDAPLVLNDLSLRIGPGEFVAIVGESGCGKSTLMRMLLGFEKPLKGSVYYDNQDLAGLDVREVRRQIGVVLQSSQLFPGEIHRNIIGMSSLSVEDAWNAARMVGLDADLEEMPMGIYTYVSEGGGGLSGGQRQRILIARALVRKPSILLFDEATSALDNRSQAVVTESMNSLRATRIVIAHRLSTIIGADRICYMEAGRIVESGTYPELMKRNGKFASLARRQIA